MLDLELLSEINQNAAKNLKKLREGRGLSQEKLAEELGIYSQSIISQFENNRKAFSLYTIVEFAEYFSVSVNDFMFSQVTIPQEE